MYPAILILVLFIRVKVHVHWTFPLNQQNCWFAGRKRVIVMLSAWLIPIVSGRLQRHLGFTFAFNEVLGSYPRCF